MPKQKTTRKKKPSTKKKSSPSKKQPVKKSVLAFDISFGAPSLTQKVLFAKNMSVMLQSGMTLLDALNTVQVSLSGSFKKIMAKVIEKVQSGISLSESIAPYPKFFPDMFIHVTRAGEASGTLAENLEHVAVQLKKDKDLVTKIRGAMVYPIIILVATFFLGLAVSFFILPEIVPLFTGLGVELPFTTQALITFSTFVEAHGLRFFGAIIATMLGSIWLIRRKFMKPVTHWILLHTPIIRKIVRHANLARFTNTLGTSLKSGIPIDDALDITRRSVGNIHYQRALKKITAQIQAGVQLADEMAKKETLFPMMMTRMVQVGEESGNIEQTLLYLSDFYEEEVSNSIKTFTTMLEPLLLLFIGGAVGFLALSIISPIYEITGNVQR